MAVPSIGTKVISYLGTRWTYVGPSANTLDDGTPLYRVRCTSPNPQGLSSYQTGSELEVPESWFDRMSVVDPNNTPPGANRNGNGR